MKTQRRLHALFAVPLLVAIAPTADEPAFGPADGSRVTRSFAIRAEFELDDATAIVDGQDFSEMIPGDLGFSSVLLMRVSDLFVRSAEGRPLELIRAFEEMSAEAETLGETEDIEGFDELEGKQVRFLWVEDDEQYQVSFHESDGDEDLLAGLSVDMELRALLPGKAVEEGDTWTVEADDLYGVLLFGNRAEMGGAGGDEISELVESQLAPQFEALMDDFSTSCEYAGSRDEDGRRVGVIEVRMNGEGSIDLAPVILAVIEHEAAEVEFEIDVETAEVRVSFESEGRLLWDLAEGHMHGFTMDGDIDLTIEVDVAVDAGGESHELSGDAEMTGRLGWKAARESGD